MHERMDGLQLVRVRVVHIVGDISLFLPTRSTFICRHRAPLFLSLPPIPPRTALPPYMHASCSPSCFVQSWYSLPPKEIRDLSDDEGERESGCVLLPCAQVNPNKGDMEEGDDAEIEALVNPASPNNNPCGHPCGGGCVVC